MIENNTFSSWLLWRLIFYFWYKYIKGLYYMYLSNEQPIRKNQEVLVIIEYWILFDNFWNIQYSLW